MKDLLTLQYIYISLQRQSFFFIILWKLHLHITRFKIDFLRNQETILNTDVNDKGRGSQLIGPSYF